MCFSIRSKTNFLLSLPISNMFMGLEFVPNIINIIIDTSIKNTPDPREILLCHLCDLLQFFLVGRAQM